MDYPIPDTPHYWPCPNMGFVVGGDGVVVMDWPLVRRLAVQPSTGHSNGIWRYSVVLYVDSRTAEYTKHTEGR
jgi:hypothetical protein